MGCLLGVGEGALLLLLQTYLAFPPKPLWSISLPHLLSACVHTTAHVCACLCVLMLTCVLQCSCMFTSMYVCEYTVELSNIYHSQEACAWGLVESWEGLPGVCRSSLDTPGCEHFARSSCLAGLWPTLCLWVLGNTLGCGCVYLVVAWVQVRATC